MGYCICSYRRKAYYVIFSWDYYSQNPGEILNIRGGGLAIYGGVIAGVITTFVFSKIRQVPFLRLADTACTGLLVGQIMGRWGNFFNREAFGGYTDSLFAMQIRMSDVNTSYITDELYNNVVSYNGIDYIQVHPAFYMNLCGIYVYLQLYLFLQNTVSMTGSYS